MMTITIESLMAAYSNASGSEWLALSVELDAQGLVDLCQWAREQAANAYAAEDEVDA